MKYSTFVGLIVLLSILNVVDAFFTVYAVESGRATELNPLAGYLLDISPNLLLSCKVTASVMLLATLTKVRKIGRYGRLLLVFTNVIYVMITIYHVYGYFTW